MAETGFVSLLIALALSIYGMIGSVAGKGTGAQQLQESAKRTAYLVPAALLISTLSLVVAFLRRDFSLEYVAGNSNLAMDPIYTWVAFYAGNEGSLLYIAFVLSLMTAAAAAFAPRSLRGSMPYTLAILMGIQTFLLGVMSIMANPFDVLPSTPPDGQGINPLLTHPGMFFHPPMLMAGLIGVSVPFALAMGMLINNSTSDDWVDAGRVWSLIIWAILGIGLLLGSWWAYTILGWGGYWAWDPIENVALMPWLVLTGFLHSIMVQKRRGLFRVWNVVLMNVAFTLALFGIFINRGGPVVSVHSFASSTLGMGLPGVPGVQLAVLLWRLLHQVRQFAQHDLPGLNAVPGSGVPCQQSAPAGDCVRDVVGRRISSHIGGVSRRHCDGRRAVLRPDQRAVVPGADIPHGSGPPDALENRVLVDIEKGPSRRRDWLRWQQWLCCWPFA